MDCKERAKKIYEICVTNAKAGKILTYREVLNFLGYRPIVPGHAIKFALELTWIACAYSNLPILTSIIVNKATRKPSGGYSRPEEWQNDVQKVFNHQEWPTVDDINWDYVWENRRELSTTHRTRGYWL
jgi:hypothetical protein